MKIDSIIFDLDGTLWDSSAHVTAAWNKVIRESGLLEKTISTADIRSIMGMTLPEIADTLFAPLPSDQRLALIHACSNAECAHLALHGGVLYEQVEKTLAALTSRYPLFLVSNCEPNYLQAFFIYHKLSAYFTDTECAGATHLSKGENIKLIMQRNHLLNPTYVGDTQSDFDAARIANIPFVLAGYGHGTVAQEVPEIEEFSALPLALLSMEGC